MKEDILCFCHIRWNFVYQRPQHLLSRFAQQQRVFIIEEPVFDALSSYNSVVYDETDSLWIVTPHVDAELTADKIPQAQKTLLDILISTMEIEQYLLWYYSPMALQFSQHLTPSLTIYDCMDELSAFKFAPPALKQFEAILFKKADVVFTGGHHLYEAKRKFHHNIHAFPSSIDKEHFIKARGSVQEPGDQAGIPSPRIGFYGVVDERFDIELLQQVADRKPGWNFIIIGPVVKIDPAVLPGNSNIYYLGGKEYNELPGYLAGWDIAMLPFAINEATKYISTTKTPEYLAGGKPVISTAIRDVVTPYGEQQLVHIIDTAGDFIKAGEKILQQSSDEKESWLKASDLFLKDNSWDNTWRDMKDIIEQTMFANRSLKSGMTQPVAKSA